MIANQSGAPRMSFSTQTQNQSAKVAQHSYNLLKIVFLAVSTALVFVVTRLAYVPISAFNGQVFDLGDIMIFTFAWTFGTAVGGFAGGVSSYFSDALVPSHCAPCSFVIKCAKGVF